MCFRFPGPLGNLNTQDVLVGQTSFEQFWAL